MVAENATTRADAMTHLLLLCTTLLLVPAAAALTITSPTADIAATSLPTSVTATWQNGTGPYTVTLEGQAPITTNETQHTYSLGAGSYLLTVQGQNATAQKGFSVTTATPTISIAADSNTYDIGDVVRITATSDKQITATLTLALDGNTVETYTVSIDGSVDLFYIPEEPGTYLATLKSQGATATTTWNANAQQPLTVDFTHTAPLLHERTTFTATASGGVAPYTYKWLFSDDTAGTGQENNHYFFSAGQHSATLIVTDAENTQKSVEKSFTVTEDLYDIDITVRSDHGDALEDLTITLKQNSSEEEEQTDETGTATFTDLRGVYNLTITQANKNYLNATINVDEDDNLLYTIIYGETDATNTTNTTTPSKKPEPEPEQTITQAPPQEDPAQPLEEAKSEARDALEKRRFNLKLDPKKDRVLNALELYSHFDDAIAAVEQATDEDKIAQATEQAPTKVAILDEKSTVSYPDPDRLDDAIDTFLKAKAVVDEKLAKKYARNIKELAKNVSVRTTTIKARIDYGDEQQTWTLVTRNINGAPGADAIEIIPKSFAADVSELKLEGNYDVLESDPVIRFAADTYSYAAQTDEPVPQAPIIVPETLQDYGLLSGLLSVTIGQSDSTRSMVYLALLAIIAAGVFVGRRINTPSSGVFEDFSSLAGQALDMITNGQAVQAAQLAPDIHAIYEELPADQQAALAEVMSHISENATAQQFLHTIDQAYSTVSQHADDVNTVTRTYEEAIGAYEQLPESLQTQLKEHIQRLHDHLDNTLQI